MECHACKKSFEAGEERVLMPCTHGQLTHYPCGDAPMYLCLNDWIEASRRAGRSRYWDLVSAW